MLTTRETVREKGEYMGKLYFLHNFSVNLYCSKTFLIQQEFYVSNNAWLFTKACYLKSIRSAHLFKMQKKKKPTS